MNAQLLRHKGDILLLLLALLATLGAVRNLAEISKVDPWFHNLDMDTLNVVDALLINSDHSAGAFDQPGIVMKSLLALDYRVRHRLARLDVWNLGVLEAQPNPLAVIPDLIAVGRTHSRILVSAFIVMVGMLIYVLCRSVKAAALGVIVIAGSSGLLFQGLLTRPELLCVFFGQILAFLCMCRGIQAGRRAIGGIWFAATGLGVGFATLDKLPGFLYLLIYGGWVILDSITPGRISGETETPPKDYWLVVWPETFLIVLVGGTMYWFTNLLWSRSLGMEPIEVSRLHLVSAALVFGAILIHLPLPGQWRQWWQTSLRRCLLLVSGAVASLPLLYLLLRLTMSERSASNYICNVLHTVVQPSGVISAYAGNQHMFAEFGKFMAHDPWLIGMALLGTILMWVLVRRQWAVKLACAVLLLTAFGMAMMMAKRYFVLHYVIFTQVPLLLVVALVVHAAAESGLAGRVGWGRWFWAGISLAACGAIWVNTIRLEREYATYQGFEDSSNQVEFIYRNGTLPGAYRLLMRNHYGDEAGFEKSLNTLTGKTQGSATLGEGGKGTVDR